MIVGTRGSRLSLIQTEIAIRNLGLASEVKVVSTSGDTSTRPIGELGGRAFTRELDEALLAREVDAAVHSLKDVPVEGFPEGLEIACVVERSDPRDCIISRAGALSELPLGAVVGASSERRKAELLNLRGDLKVKPLRGNIPTRLKKLDGGEYDVIIAAKCALERLGLSGRARQVFEVEEMVPAAGQGAIAVVVRKGFPLDVPLACRSLLTPCLLERRFIEGLGACRQPVGAYCVREGGVFRLTGLVYRGGVRFVPSFAGDFEGVCKAVASWKRELLG